MKITSGVLLVTAALAMSSCSVKHSSAPDGSSIEQAIVIKSRSARLFEEGNWIDKLFPGADTQKVEYTLHLVKGRSYDRVLVQTPQGKKELYLTSRILKTRSARMVGSLD